MYVFQKYTIMRIFQAVAFFGILLGLEQMVSAGLSGTKGRIIVASIILFGSAVLGVVASVLTAYYKAHEQSHATQNKIEVDTLEKLGRQKH